MKSDLYLSCDWEWCLLQGHHFRMTWSDKHPKKASLQCVTCSERFQKNAYVAYGVEARSFGPWHRAPLMEEAPIHERTTDE